jgi:hypothetical protein
MARLPTVGGDNGNWGTVLNEFLQISLNTSGTLKNRALNVMDYGAIGDGSTNDSPAINATIAALPSMGGTILFPPGTYLIGSTITIDRDDVALVGGGGRSSATLQAANGLNAAMIATTQPTTGAQVRRGIRIEHLYLNGNSSQQSSGGAIDLIGTYHAVVNNCLIQYAKEYGIRINRASGQTSLPYAAYNLIHDVVISHGSSIGVDFGGSSDWNWLMNSLIDWHTDVGCIAVRSDSWWQRVSWCSFDANRVHMSMANAKGVSVDHCTFDRTVSQHVIIDGRADSSRGRGGNRFTNCTFHGVHNLAGSGTTAGSQFAIDIKNGADGNIFDGGGFVYVDDSLGFNMTVHEFGGSQNTHFTNFDFGTVGAVASGGVAVNDPQIDPTSNIIALTSRLAPPLQAVAYASSITVDTLDGEVVNVGALTGSITINAPTNAATGQKLTFIFTQDGVGGRTVTWNAVFKVAWTPTTTASKINTITFIYDGTSWIQIATAIGI